MNVPGKLRACLAGPILTRGRIAFAFTVALITDALQLVLGPLGWAFVDETLDVIAMVLTTAAIGFHPLLLPTFVVEFVPVVDMLPTWTGCTAAVVMLRRKAQAPTPPVIPTTVSSTESTPPAPKQLPESSGS